MHENSVQKFFAHAALFFMPMPVLNFGISFTLGDIFLLLAMLFNIGEAIRLQSFQLPFLLAFPLVLMSEILDVNCTLISVLQVIYIWGLMLPFGWCAFTNLEPRRVAQVLLLAGALNCVVAVGQGVGVVPILERQRNISIHGEFNRAAGLSSSCNSLVMELTPYAPLLVFLPTFSVRVGMLLALLAGGVSSVSKALVLTLPGLLFYYWREPRKLLVAGLFGLCLLGAVALVMYDEQVGDSWSRLVDGLDHRSQYVDESIEDRWELIELGLKYAPHCYLLGYGTGGTVSLISQSTNNTVHVYLLGTALIGGFPAMLLILAGSLTIIYDLKRFGEVEFAWSLTAHLLACLVTTVLMFSFQSLPVMVAGGILARRLRPAAPALALPKSAPLRRAA
jgi:hypothetical protein